MKNKKLHDRLDAFLSKRKRSIAGGWAPVEINEIIFLGDLIIDIVKAKYQMDADGDLPIEFTLVDRNTCQSLLYRALPYPSSIKDKNEIESAEEMKLDILHYQYAKYNLQLAQDDFHRSAKAIDEMLNEFGESIVEMTAQQESQKGPVVRLG